MTVATDVEFTTVDQTRHTIDNTVDAGPAGSVVRVSLYRTGDAAINTPVFYSAEDIALMVDGMNQKK